MKLADVVKHLEKLAPLSLQESYDNSGLSVGNKDREIKGAVICLDVTPEVLDEAIDAGCNLVISHHPAIFGGLKRLTGSSLTEEIVEKAVKNDIALYSAHTNLDNVFPGVNKIISDKLGLVNQRILRPSAGLLKKLVTFCPHGQADTVRDAVFAAGAGFIGNYDSCSYNTDGFGTFRAGEGANPYVGEINKVHSEKEYRIETIFPAYRQSSVISALLAAHPYEEVAYDIYPLDNLFDRAGAGMTGELDTPLEEITFLKRVKDTFGTAVIRHSGLNGRQIKKVALCGGSGSFLIKDAISSGADIFLTGDVKYHQFFEATQTMIIADIGHYESEQYTSELIYNWLNQKFPNFALRISKINTNPVNYL